MEFGQRKQTRLHNLPIPGQRIVRSVIAVALCFVVYELRGRRGIPFYSALAVLQCMQPYKDSTLQMAKKRTTGTFVGAVLGSGSDRDRGIRRKRKDYRYLLGISSDCSVYRCRSLFNGCDEDQPYRIFFLRGILKYYGDAYHG